jgi:hypothetical protein
VKDEKGKRNSSEDGKGKGKAMEEGNGNSNWAWNWKGKGIVEQTPGGESPQSSEKVTWRKGNETQRAY